MVTSEFQALSDKLDKVIEKQTGMAVDIGEIKTNYAAIDRLNHECRLRDLEDRVNQWLGSKALLLWLVTTGIAVWAAVHK
jgi:hypothetical protein